MWRRKREARTGVRAKLIRLCLILLVIGAGIYGWYSYSQRPSVGVVQVSPENKIASEAVKIGHFKGSLITFDYPAVYTDTQSNKPSGNTVEQYSLGARIDGAESRRISITINKSVNGDTLKDDSAYKFRLADTTNYDNVTVIINERPVEKFMKKNGGEITYFIPSPKYYAIVSGTSTRANGDFITDTASAVSSFAWTE